MPCRVDLFQGYNWYDSNDLADHMYFNTPLVPLMCEVMKLIEGKGMLSECSDIVQQWYKYHQADDAEKEITGKRLKYHEHQEQLKPFIQHMQDIGFSVTTGILTEEQRKWKAEEQQKRDEEYKEVEKLNNRRREEEQTLRERGQQTRKRTIDLAIINTIGHNLTEEERKIRMKIEYETILGSKRAIEIHYLDNVEILRYQIDP